jgi:UDP-N-acetylmuramoylalanine--D-glutamate ligase
MDNKFKNKKIAVIGAGVEGVASAEWLVKQGADVVVVDANESSGKELRAKGIEIVAGKNYLDNLDQYDMIVRSPGIKLNLPELVAAKEKGVIITSQTKLFFDLCPAPIIGVTGTKGKGTTASLIYEMIKKEGLDVYVGGNIGVPPLTFLDDLKPTSWVVLELSSFQLEDLDKSPHIAVMLMIVREHLGADTVGTLNFHETMEDYVEAKRNLIRFQKTTDFAILNRDYPATHESDIHTIAKVLQVSREQEAAGDGCFTRQGNILVRRDDKEHEILPVADVLLPGAHNIENICAAAMAAVLAGVSRSTIASVLRTFKGLEHRLELVKEVRGVRYYDDSFSTTPETAIAAIEAFDAPEILILGGSTKNSDFTELGDVLNTRSNIKAVIGIDPEWKRIKKELKIESFDNAQEKSEKRKIIEGCKNMDEIVKKAAELAQPGDVVLLTPACASFGMFNNYKERGDLFKQAVDSL